MTATAQITSQVPSYLPENPNAWAELGPDLLDCDPDFGCDPCDDQYYECAAAAVYFFFADTGLVIDAPTGLFDAYTVETLITSSGLQSAASDPGLSVSVNVTAPWLGSSSTQGSDMYAVAVKSGQISQAGIYMATGVAQPFVGCIIISGGCAQFIIPAITTSDTETFTAPPACSPPTIDSILVNSGNGPQQISELPIGSTGTIAVYGTCLDGMTTISVGFDPSGDYAGNSSGVNISNISAPGWGVVNASYSVASGTMPETVLLTVTTSSGSVTANLDVVSAGPYIDSINPITWLPGAFTTVAISGSGFGTSQGSLTVTAPAGDVSLSSIQSWSDNAIVMTVATGPNSAGETVTVTVTGGTVYGLTTGFQNSSTRATGQSASAQGHVATDYGCGYPELNLLIAEYTTFQSDLQPNCNSFIALTWVGNPGWQVGGSIPVPVGSQAVPISDLNWSWYMDWAIVLPSLTTGLNSILANAPPGQLIIDSAYRNPAKEYTYTQSTHNPLQNAGTSRHVHGDAADLGTQKSDSLWTTMYNAVKSSFGQPVNYCVEPRDQPMAAAGGSSSSSSNNHLHIDWRLLDGSSACPTGWNP